MVTRRWGGAWLLGLVALERGVELWLSARNTRRALREGAIEVGRATYVPMVLVHGALLPACALELARTGGSKGRWRALGVVGAFAAQALRYWAVATLGRRWSTRIVVFPGREPVRGGPYRWMRHPNYLAVAVEMASVPLAVGCWRTAAVFSALNAWLLSVRIPLEERALGPRYLAAFAGTRRFVPGGRGHTPSPPSVPHHVRAT